MSGNHLIYVLIMFGVIYAIRVLPLTLIRGKVKNRLLKSFLYYVPYITLAVMTFPAIMQATENPLSGLIALAVCIVMALFGLGLFPCAIAASVIVYLLEMFL
jgi:branched-subunit amino acid transport protein